ncbi:MAG: PHP domain-containing protein [Dehalococcoidales bacterium]|nr:MAG: PHP domain-containing protein [Dehalococcoidales bacterium]
MSKVDLHLHSSASDGVLSPTEVVAKAAELGLTTVSLTDHDNVDGIAPALKAAEKYPDMVFIPGLEISTDTTTGEIHVLGYYIDHTNPELLSALKKLRDSRLGRAQKMIQKLSELGMPIDWEYVEELSGDGSVGRPHVAQALLDKGYIDTIKEAFSKYIAFGGPAYVPRSKMTPREAVELIIRADGLAVLAHPLGISNLETLLKTLTGAGLVGIEVYYKDYPTEDRESLARLADKHGLIATGGTDYHGLDDNTEVMMGEAGVPPYIADNIITLAENRSHKLTLR